MSFDVFNELATDSNLEENGAWFDLGKGGRLLIARAGNRAFSKALNKAVEKNKQLLDGDDDASEAKSDEIMADVLARTILLGWEGISYQGQDLPYTQDNARKALSIKDFRTRVQQFSNEFDAYKLKQEVVQGNA